MNSITYFGETDFRNEKKRFGIYEQDRSRHMYVVGKTGMGKSTLLENMAIQDIQNGKGIAFMDPHGGTAEKLLSYVPKHRIKDVLYFAPFDIDYPISFNVLEDVGFDKRHLVASGLMSAFKKIWVDAWSARMEYILNNILLALLEYQDATLLGVNRMLADKDYRNRVVSNIKDISVKSFWVDEFSKYGERYMQEAGAAIQNKIGQFISNPVIRNLVGQPDSSFDMRKLMDEGKIVIVNLSVGKVGEDNAKLLGSMLVTKIYLSAMSRADLTPWELEHVRDFNFYVDEFQSFVNDSFSDILSQARKYKLALVIAHQYMAQLPENVLSAVLGNVGTLVTFRVGADDAAALEKEFAPYFTIQDIVNLGFAQMYLRLMIHGVASKPFSALGMYPISPPPEIFVQEIIESSRGLYAKPKSEVEENIIFWHKDRGGIIERAKQRESETIQEVSREVVGPHDKPSLIQEIITPLPTINREAKNEKGIKPYTDERSNDFSKLKSNQGQANTTTAPFPLKQSQTNKINQNYTQKRNNFDKQPSLLPLEKEEESTNLRDALLKIKKDQEAKLKKEVNNEKNITEKQETTQANNHSLRGIKLPNVTQRKELRDTLLKFKVIQEELQQRTSQQYSEVLNKKQENVIKGEDDIEYVIIKKERQISSEEVKKNIQADSIKVTTSLPTKPRALSPYEAATHASPAVTNDHISQRHKTIDPRAALRAKARSILQQTDPEDEYMKHGSLQKKPLSRSYSKNNDNEIPKDDLMRMLEVEE